MLRVGGLGVWGSEMPRTHSALSSEPTALRTTIEALCRKIATGVVEERSSLAVPGGSLARRRRQRWQRRIHPWRRRMWRRTTKRRPPNSFRAVVAFN